MSTNQTINYMKDFKEMKQKMDYITDTVSNSLKNREGNTIVFIDELDRCRPEYIINFLMRIKHIFNIPKLIFVVSMNMEALRGACNSEFGKHKSAQIEGYINRFFHPRLALPPPDHRALAYSMQSYIGSGHLDKFHMFLENFDVPPRCFYYAIKHFKIIRSLHNDAEGYGHMGPYDACCFILYVI